ncbi:S8 family peptidase [Isoptericola sp. QY 916]|uniref:S8 family peptidase n=1 Tax=Isoptericola sp. QY 916 TaxID=2782570 RepID=UPI003D2FD422|nr:S8 family serine peptidase [Isoptericola sp. QY 916]
MTETPSGPSGRPMRPVDPPMRYLDPNALRARPGRRAVEPTWYVADRVIVHGELPGGLRDRLRRPGTDDPRPRLLDVEYPDDDGAATRVEREARRQGCRLGLQVRYRPDAQGAEGDPLDGVDEEHGFVLRLLPENQDAEPDAWGALEADGADESTSWSLSLDHVMTALPFSSHPFSSHPSAGMAEYAVPGAGGRAPVRWLGGAPSRQVRDDGDMWRTPDGVLRPVVAVLDTGVGTHDWFGTYSVDDPTGDGNGVVVRDAVLPDGPIGTLPFPEYPEGDAEIGGAITSPLTGPLDPVAGHGTFIAGIVHQVCPDALILPVRVVDGSGVTAESDVIESLRRLARFHRRGLDGDVGYVAVDVVVLSMGYYHERPEDMRWDHPLRAVLGELRDSGVAVVVAAGNDGETRPEFPAAFAPSVDRRTEPPTITDAGDTSASRPPILTVGAQNPDGTTALFSNDGPWVTCLRPGAGVVSTVPKTLDGPLTPSMRLKERHSNQYRSTIDPEGFQGGFATWSGTSFAAPVLAGEIARALLGVRRDAEAEAGPGRPDRLGGERVRQIWSAITTATGGLSLGGADRPER